MTRTYNLSNQGGFLQNLMRSLFVVGAAIGGLFLFAASAAFAFFVVVGLLILGFVVFAFFWARTKLFGKKFGPQVQFEAAKADMEARFGGRSSLKDTGVDGPIIDAHRTPDGWSVDD